MNSDLFLYSLAVFACAMAGGLITFVRQWSDEFLHLFVAFGAGIFLGVVFLHLLPESFGHGHSSFGGIPILVGFLLIFFVERILLTKGGDGYDSNHKIISLTVFFGLSVHSIFEGVGLAVGTLDANIGPAIFVSIISHKIPASFSLASLFILGKMPKRKAIGLLTIFALMAPLGALLFSPLLEYAGEDTIELFTGLTAGTFLYVATSDLLPEAFHNRKNRWVRLGLLILGVLIMIIVGNEHGH